MVNTAMFSFGGNVTTTDLIQPEGGHKMTPITLISLPITTNQDNVYMFIAIIKWTD